MAANGSVLLRYAMIITAQIKRTLKGKKNKLGFIKKDFLIDSEDL